VKLLCCVVATDVVAISEISFGPMSLKATGTHHAKRCEGPASQGKRVHFREGQENVLRPWQKIVLAGPETREGGCHAGVHADSSSSVGWQAEAEHA